MRILLDDGTAISRPFGAAEGFVCEEIMLEADDVDRMLRMMNSRPETFKATMLQLFGRFKVNREGSLPPHREDPPDWIDVILERAIEDQIIVPSQALSLKKIFDQIDTPAAMWRVRSREDPHGDKYDCDRKDLLRGDLTDDEMANAVFLDPNIVNLTAAKERIRWLSRKLCAALSRQNKNLIPKTSKPSGKAPAKK